MKKITITLILAAVLIGGFFAFNNYIYSEKQTDTEVGETVTETGRILAVDLDPLAYDGPGMVTIQTESGMPKNIAIPARGFSMCPGFKNVADINSLTVGKNIEVKGQLDSEGAITPCESESHYLRIK